jgi:hypothetical protein
VKKVRFLEEGLSARASGFCPVHAKLDPGEAEPRCIEEPEEHRAYGEVKSDGVLSIVAGTPGWRAAADRRY